eukprot:363301-Chlamydomonas_euryale.AAC.5
MAWVCGAASLRKVAAYSRMQKVDRSQARRRVGARWCCGKTQRFPAAAARQDSFLAPSKSEAPSSSAIG